MATLVAPDPGKGSVGAPPARSVAPTGGGGSWRPLSEERKADLELAHSSFGKTSEAGKAARERQGVRDVPAGTTRALPTEAIDQQQIGNTLSLALAGAGVVGTGIALARGGAWWLSLLLLPAAGVAFYLTRYKPPAPVKS